MKPCKTDPCIRWHTYAALCINSVQSTLQAHHALARGEPIARRAAGEGDRPYCSPSSCRPSSCSACTCGSCRGTLPCARGYLNHLNHPPCFLRRVYLAPVACMNVLSHSYPTIVKPTWVSTNHDSCMRACVMQTLRLACNMCFAQDQAQQLLQRPPPYRPQTVALAIHTSHRPLHCHATPRTPCLRLRSRPPVISYILPVSPRRQPAPSSVRLEWPKKRGWATVFLEKINDTVRTS